MPEQIHQGEHRVVVLSAPNSRQAKRFSIGPDGLIDVQSYGQAMYFEPSVHLVTSLTDFYQLIALVSQRSDSFLIRGALRPDADSARLVRRRLRREDSTDPNEYAIVDRPCCWLMIDFDKIALPSDVDVTKDAEAAMKGLVQLLPVEFHGASFVWQLSSSCGVHDTSTVSAHIFFWLSKPWLNEHLRAWGAKVNGETGAKLIDTAVFNAVQPLYVANPSFDGLDDPIRGNRIGYVSGDLGCVTLSFEPSAQHTVGFGRTGQAINGAGYEAKLHYLGDGVGELGFNNVLVSAVAAYVANVGRDVTLACREDLKEDLRSHIADADQSKHTQSEIQRYTSDVYLNGLIDSAIEKFGGKEFVQPHWNSKPISLTEAEQRLSETIESFGEAARAYWEELNADRPMLAIKATAGLGKTQSVIKRLLAYNLLEKGDVHYYVPTHKLSKQLLQDLNAELSLEPEGADYVYQRARVIGGRSQLDESGQPLCRKHQLANKIASIGGHVYPLLCRNKTGQCEFYDSCAYLQQMDDLDELEHDEMFKVLTEVKVMTHEHLFLRSKERFLDPSLVVIDESFVRSAFTKVEVPVTDLLTFAGPDSLIAQLGMLLLRRPDSLLREVRELCSSDKLLDELDEHSSLQANPFSAVDIDAPLNDQLEALSGKPPNRTPVVIRTLCEEIQLTDRDMSHAVVCDGKTVSVLRRKDIELPAAPVLMIDADADPILLAPFFGQKVPIETISVERKATVHQFRDRTFSKTSLIGDGHKADHLLTTVRRFIEDVAAGGKTLVVSSKAIRAAITGENTSEIGDESAHLGAVLVHFNSLRGVNKYSSFQNVIIIGREQPASTGLEEVARGIWYDDPEPLRLLENKSGSRPMESEQRGYRLRDGSAGVSAQVHPDWRVQALQEQIREAESTQAIDRLRLLRSDPEGLERHVFILSSLPLDITVDHLWNWDELQEAQRILDACNGVIPLNPEHLRAVSPDIGSKESAKRRVAAIKRVTSLIDILISNLTLLTAEYKVSGQKRSSSALYDSTLDLKQVEQRLSELAGEPVKVFDSQK